MFYIFYPTASAMAYGQKPKFVRAEHLATAKGENCAYGPTLLRLVIRLEIKQQEKKLIVYVFLKKSLTRKK